VTRRCPSRRRQQRRSQSLVAPMPSKAYFLFSAMWGAHRTSLLPPSAHSPRSSRKWSRWQPAFVRMNQCGPLLETEYSTSSAIGSKLTCSRREP